MSNTLETSPASGANGFGTVIIRYADWIVGIGVLAMLVTLITPVAPFVLDIMLAMNITISLMLLLVTMNVKSSAELTTFPTILLFVTLFRLGLNVASTRLILAEGEAGTVIQAFGSYVVGANRTVGVIVFLILVIIQFVVITKGAGRISEVSARFVLDAMPGKQMAIDADLNAGLIDSAQAKRRRELVSGEAEFYGAMDGASKFVRGDAIAGLIITSLNLVGGIAIGAMGGKSIAEAADTYTMLTIGDGLVSQIPALFVSTAAAVLVTKAKSRFSLGSNLIAQVSSRPKATLIAAGMVFCIGLLPGMPALPFFVLASVLAVLWTGTRGVENAESMLGEGEDPFADAPMAQAAAEEEDGKAVDSEVEELLNVDRLSLEIGIRLISLVQDKSGTGILDHVGQLRRRLAMKEGVLLPQVRIKDNVRLEPNAYRILLGGQEIARGTVEPNHVMALDGGLATGKLSGKETVDPTFGLPAWWIAESQQDEAEMNGFTVIDPTSVLVTHFSEMMQSALGELLTRDDVKDLVENLKASAPAIVEELLPERMSYGELHQVLRNLLNEGVPIRNMEAILECLSDNAARTRDPELLSEMVRQRLGRALCEAHADRDGCVHAVTLDPAVEARLAASVGNRGEADAAPVNPAWLQKLMENVAETVAVATSNGKDVVLLVRSNVRRFLHELVQASMPKVAVLSYNEVVPAKSVETEGIVRMEES
ncbi:MAG: flagellar biosynthesis protein FlhA [Planctomycetota bacterium]|nr:flagellar biosynthesis protein FlhA [Planctomycetota bacterium]MDG2143223.1 flagellar biosynthesis protein FlhA [Planctomycetota bacterium]